MSGFDSLALALENWFDKSLCELPDATRQRVEQEFSLVPWDGLSGDQRRTVAQQLDYQHDPATEREREYWWEFSVRKRTLGQEIAKWEAIDTLTGSDLAQQETNLTDLRQNLAQMELQERHARGDNYPAPGRRGVADGKRPKHPTPIGPYIPYPMAMSRLAARLEATPEEVAAWVWGGLEDGGLAAFLRANELDPPPRFDYVLFDDFDYLSPLMSCWFCEGDIAAFTPTDRYITGKALIERWSKPPGIDPLAFIQAKIAESRLLDIHPICGGTQGTYPRDASYPPLTSGLFPLSQVVEIEGEDLGLEQPGFAAETGACSEVGTPQWRRRLAAAAANARHDKPGGSREKQTQIREAWATGKYSTRDLCAEQECAALNMPFGTARRALRNTPDPKPPSSC